MVDTLAQAETQTISPPTEADEARKILASQFRQLVETKDPDKANTLAANIRNSTTKEHLVSGIFAHPSITINGNLLNPGKINRDDPDQTEIEYASRELVCPLAPSEANKEMFEALMEPVRKYLLSPTIHDEFQSHEERERWEKAVIKGLTLVDNTGTKRGEFLQAFKDVWDGNKNTGTSQTRVHTAIGIVESLLNDNEIYAGKLRALAERYEKVEVVKKPPEMIQETTQIAKDFIDLFSTPDST